MYNYNLRLFLFYCIFLFVFCYTYRELCAVFVWFFFFKKCIKVEFLNNPPEIVVAVGWGWGGGGHVFGPVVWSVTCALVVFALQVIWKQ